MKFHLIVTLPLSLLCLCMPGLQKINAQGTAPVLKIWDGIVVAGYVDKGAYVNFTGPAVKWTQKPHQLLLGVLPTLKIKTDPQPVKNSVITPMLGFGATWAFRHFVVQVPLYYQPKTATVSGRWKPGLGVGAKF